MFIQRDNEFSQVLKGLKRLPYLQIVDDEFFYGGAKHFKLHRKLFYLCYRDIPIPKPPVLYAISIYKNDITAITLYYEENVTPLWNRKQEEIEKACRKALERWWNAWRDKNDEIYRLAAKELKHSILHFNVVSAYRAIMMMTGAKRNRKEVIK